MIINTIQYLVYFKRVRGYWIHKFIP